LFRAEQRIRCVDAKTRIYPASQHCSLGYFSLVSPSKGSLKGIIAAVYSLGAILSLSFIPIVNGRFGRRWSIFGGSVITIIGALIQGASQHGTFPATAELELAGLTMAMTPSP
jgi:MFS family permease